MSDRIAVINHGRLMQLDKPRRLYDRPANRFVADFIGESTFLPVTLANGGASYGGMELKLAEAADGRGGARDLLLRPERLSILTGEPDPYMNVFKGRVTELVFQGESFLMYAELADGAQLAVRGAANRDIMERVPPVGGEVALGLHRDDTVLVAADEG